MFLYGLGYNKPKTKKQAASILITDNFNRDNTVDSLGIATTGQEWVNAQGVWFINNNRALTNTVGAAVAYLESNVSDVEIIATVSNGYEPRVMARYTDNNNFITFGRNSATNARFTTRIASVESNVDIPYDMNAVRTIKLSLKGNAINCYIDNMETPVYSTTSSHNIDATKHGLWNYTAFGGFFMDDFSIQSI